MGAQESNRYRTLERSPEKKYAFQSHRFRQAQECFAGFAVRALELDSELRGSRQSGRELG